VNWSAVRSGLLMNIMINIREFMNKSCLERIGLCFCIVCDVLLPTLMWTILTVKLPFFQLREFRIQDFQYGFYFSSPVSSSVSQNILLSNLFSDVLNLLRCLGRAKEFIQRDFVKPNPISSATSL
jgi:hypothetical protein